MANARLAQAIGYITVVDDIVSIKSADVVFAIGSNNVNPPTDGDNWKTTFAELSMTSGGYVWTCTKITKTDDSVEYSGKYCLGACSDFASITELYALGDSNTNPPADDAVWMETYTPVKGKWLWTRNRLMFQNSSDVVLTTPVCIGYFANDGTNGTSFTLKGTALGHYETISEFQDANSGLSKGLYLCDQDKNGNSVPIVIRKVVGLAYISSVIGDAYRIGTNLWVNNGSNWVDFGSIQGPAGEDGHNLQLVLNPSKFILTTDDDGNFSNNEYCRFNYAGLFGDTGIIDTTDGAEFYLSFPEGCNFDGSYANLKEKGNNALGHFDSDGIKRVTYKLADEEITSVVTSAYFVLNLKYKGFTVSQRIDIEVNLSLFTGSVVQNRHEWSANYSSLKSKQDEQGKIIEENNAQLKVQADEISSKVSQTEYDENNKVVSQSISAIVQNADNISARVKKTEDGLGEAEASLDLCVKKDKNGNLESEAKLAADQILINANHTLAITGNYMTVDTTNFKLTKDGTVTCREGSFVNVMMSGFNYRSKVTVNDDNYSEFFETKFELEGFKIDGFNIAKAGSWVEFDINTNPTSGFPSVDLPGIRPSDSYSQDKIDSARALVGSKVMFYNKGRVYVSFNGYYKTEDDGTGVSFAISQGQFAILECKLGVTSDGKEDIYWLYKRGTAHVAGS